MLFDRRESGAIDRVIEAGTELLRACVDLGGTVSGEHGIGMEKRDALPLVFTTADLAAMARVRACFDPRALFNPEKLFPAGTACVEVRDPSLLRAAAPWLC
jgi:glycolate oxidase